MLQNIRTMAEDNRLGRKWKDDIEINFKTVYLTTWIGFS